MGIDIDISYHIISYVIDMNRGIGIGICIGMTSALVSA
jgi:hypothetical protein